jgi:hypothetical protein
MSDDLNARDYLSSTFITKSELRSGGPKRLTIAKVEKAEGKSWDGKPPKPELILIFTDETRSSLLRTQENLKRIIAGYGDRVSGWVGKPIEIYFSPDIPNPKGGEPGGVRLRIPEAAKPMVFTSELEEAVPTAKKGKRTAAKSVADVDQPF